MDLLSVKGIVIRRTLWGEQGKFVDIYTENGIKTIRTSTKIKNASVTEMLAYSEFILQPSKECFYIKEADPIRMFYGLRSDLDKLNLAYYFAKIVRESGESETVRLLLNSLHFLEKTDMPLPLLRAIFQIRLLTEIGYTPLPVAGLEKVITYIETAPIERLWNFKTGNISKLSVYAEQCMEEFNNQ